MLAIGGVGVIVGARALFPSALPTLLSQDVSASAPSHRDSVPAEPAAAPTMVPTAAPTAVPTVTPTAAPTTLPARSGNDRPPPDPNIAVKLPYTLRGDHIDAPPAVAMLVGQQLQFDPQAEVGAPYPPQDLISCGSQVCTAIKSGEGTIDIRKWGVESVRATVHLVVYDSGQVAGNPTLVPSRPSSTPRTVAPRPPSTRTYAAPPPMTVDPARHYVAAIETTMGTMKADLFAGEAPVTVNNFVFLANQGYYNGSPFHRIIKGFMVQTGDPINRNGTGGPGYRFQDEPVKRRYERGTLAMANAGPNTNGSQFFIVQGTNVNLPPNYTIFGKLTDGFDTLDKIANVPVGSAPSGEPSKPRQELDLLGITIQQR